MKQTTADLSASIPVLPNRPLKAADEADLYGALSLRRNKALDFVENAAFDPGLAVYDTDYQNNQSLSPKFFDHLNQILGLLKDHYPAGARLVEVGCGKGYFVELIQAEGSFSIEGFDGAYEGENPAIGKRYLTANDRISADLVILRHVLEHIRKPHEFLFLLKEIFGAADIYIEVPDFDWIKENHAFFDITYEHVNYFSQAAMASLFSEHGKKGLMFDRQYQFMLANLGKLDFEEFSKSYAKSDNWEAHQFQDFFPEFRSKIDQISHAADRPNAGLYVWGAATKGVMFCHHLKALAPDLFAKIVGAIDINPKKVGRYLPSSKLPVVDPDTFSTRATGSEIVLIANPNYEDEIRASLIDKGLGQIKTINL